MVSARGVVSDPSAATWAFGPDDLTKGGAAS
jgi:hypothetical protein